MCLVFQGVEKGLLEQIAYLTEVATGQPHEGSIYGAEKVCNWIVFMSCIVMVCSLCLFICLF